MRTLLHLIALVWGAALVYHGLSVGLPRPVNAYDAGSLAGFGFGVLLALVGLRHFWLRLSGDDSGLGGRAGVLVVAASVALTVGAVAWRGRARGPSSECVAVLQHIQELMEASGPSEQTRARFEAARPRLLNRCENGNSERRRCAMATTTLEELYRCP